MRVDHWLLGYEDIEIQGQHAACFVNLCRSAGYAYFPLPRRGEENLIVRCRCAVASRLLRDCAVRGIRCRVLHRGGIPVLLYRYRARIGLLIGGVLGALLLYLSCGLLWDIRIEGASSSSSEHLLSQLAACGLRPGVVLADVDTREIENRMLRSGENIAWIAINRKGTVAYGQIRELQTSQSVKEEQPANLISDYDAVIDSVKPITGVAVVQAGQTVRKGALLISGIRDSATQGYRIIGASGEVIGRTEESIVIRIPLFYERKCYTGLETCEKSLIFFGKSIKLSKSTGIMGGSCDTIYKMEKWTLPKDRVLPVGVQTVRMREYRMESVERTREEAYREAMQQLDDELRQRAQDALLLSKTVRVSYSPTHCTLVCDYACLRNIAVSRPFEVTGGKRQSE
jgi:similar to stage IV sporulation protein